MPQPRHMGRVNWQGLKTLTGREIMRFLSVPIQTLIAPVVNMLLFYTVFVLALGGGKDPAFLAFLAPGLLMMTIMQNAFANAASCIIVAKMQGNIVDILIAPLSPAELCVGYIVGSVVRGVAVGLVGLLALAPFAPMAIHNIGIVLMFTLLGTIFLGALSVMAGLWADKFDHMAGMTNFVIAPLTFLSGTFYALEKLPPFWQTLALYNPFFYMIDGFRAGFTGMAETNLWVGAVYLILCNVLLIAGAWTLVRKGYKIRQ